MGKESRGGSSSDKYQFGDFTRGVVSSVKSAAKSGAEMRGDSEYMVGDVTAGAIKGAGSYAVENRCRLAGAGGSAYGMVAGAALLGPVGLVAGSLIGGAAAKSGMETITGDPKKEKQRIEAQSQYSAPPSNAAAPQGQSSRRVSTNQAPDFFSDDNYNHALPQGAFQMQGNRQRATQSNVPQQRQSRNAPSQHLGDHAYSNATAPTAPAYTSSASQYPAHQSHHKVNSRAARGTHPHTVSQANSANNEQQGYRFGDLTRGVIAKGKAARGDENSGYKFGDFTRGLFK
jgi:hypothetical protein